MAIGARAGIGQDALDDALARCASPPRASRTLELAHAHAQQPSGVGAPGALEHEPAERVGRRGERDGGVRVQALERRGSARRPRGCVASAAPPSARGPPRVERRAQRRDARIGAAPALAQPRPRGELGLERGDAAARLELADRAHEHAAGQPERGRERLAAPRRTGRWAITLGPPSAQRAATPASARGGRPSWRSIASRSRSVADSTSGSVAAGRSTGADGEAVPMPPRPRPARSARLHRARRLGAVALLLLLVVLCVGPVRSYLRARTATQQLRSEVAQLDRQHAKLQAELDERVADAPR